MDFPASLSGFASLTRKPKLTLLFSRPESFRGFFKNQSRLFSDISLYVIVHSRGTFEALVCLNNFGIFNRKTTRHIDPSGVRNEFWFRLLFYFFKHMKGFLGLWCLVSIMGWSGLDNWELLTYSWSKNFQKFCNVWFLCDNTVKATAKRPGLPAEMTAMYSDT